MNEFGNQEAGKGNARGRQFIANRVLFALGLSVILASWIPDSIASAGKRERLPHSDMKTRGDSVIETKLNAKQQEEFFDYVEAHTLESAAAMLKDCYGIDLSINAISKWSEKVRRAKADDKFYKLIGEIKEDAVRAETFAKEIGDAQKLTDANVTMLSQALFRARQSDDPRAMKNSAVLLSMLLEAVAKSKSSQASVISAETQRNRFQFDAAKLALKHANELQEIQRSSGSEREKVEQAIERLFGGKPA